MTLLEKRSRVSVLIVGLGMTVGMLPATISLAAPSPAPMQDEPMTDEQKGLAALAQAKAYFDAGQWQQAADTYRLALSYLPDNADAQAGLQSAMARLDQGETIPDVQDTITMRRQSAIQEFDASIESASQLLTGNQFTQARNTVLTAQVRLQQASGLLNESEFTERNERAQALLAEITSSETVYQQMQADEQARQLLAEQAQQAEAERQRREQQIRENLIRVRELQLQRNYSEALDIIDQILFLEEDNPVALALRDAIHTASLWQDFIVTERDREFAMSYQFEENRAATIAPRPNFGPGIKSTTGIMSYPPDWPSLSIRRTASGGYVESEEDRRVAMALDTTLPVVEFQGHTFAQAIGYLREVTQVNIHPDWKSLDFIGVSPNQRVDLELRNVTAQTVLDRVLDQLGDEIDKPRYAVQDGLLVISTEDQLRKHVETVVYDIKDLLFEVPYFDNAPGMDLDEVLSGGAALAASRGNAFAGTNLAARNGNQGIASESERSADVFNEGGVDPDRRTRSEIVDGIVQMIQGNVDGESWKDFGGDTGVIQEMNGNLVITQTPRNHQQIEGLLSQLREIRALQINIESRFLTVDMNWFEKIGFDLDLYFNTNNTVRQQQLAVDPLGHLSDFFDGRGRLKDPLVFDSFTQTNAFSNQVAFGSQFGVPDATGQNITYLTGPVGPPIRPTDGFAPIGFNQDHLNLVNLLGGFGADSFAGTVLANNPALTLGIQFLDDVQVDLLIEATQADRRNVVLTAPRLTLFNGQRAWVLVGTQTAIVTALIPVVGDNSGAFLPILSSLTDGVVLDVEAVASADRRYVTLTVITGLREVVSIETLEFTGAAGGGGGSGGGGGGQANVFSGVISLPEVEVALINTTTTVPDKGTVLIGGQRLIREVEVESGVPILSKIPYINRFFTNRITSKDESTLLILIRPEIIIQQENEDLLFPGLSDNLGMGSVGY